MNEGKCNIVRNKMMGETMTVTVYSFKDGIKTRLCVFSSLSFLIILDKAVGKEKLKMRPLRIGYLLGNKETKLTKLLFQTIWH